MTTTEEKPELCPNCGKKNEPYYEFCVWCGKKNENLPEVMKIYDRVVDNAGIVIYWMIKKDSINQEIGFEKCLREQYFPVESLKERGLPESEIKKVIEEMMYLDAHPELAVSKKSLGLEGLKQLHADIEMKYGKLQ